MYKVNKNIDNFLVLSDLHLEFGELKFDDLSGIDAVVLAGDIEVKARGCAWARNTFGDLPIIYVMGNHEYYGGSIGHTLKKNLLAAKEFEVFVLDNDSVEFNNVRFIGATLWTDYQATGNQSLAMFDAKASMSDFKKIRDEMYRKVSPQRIAQLHMNSKHYINEELGKPFEGASVVVSHHAPCVASIHKRYKENSSHLNASYASNLEEMMDAKKVQAWVHGHVHDSFDYQLSGNLSRVICNPRGYLGVQLNTDFDPRKTVKVSDLMELKIKAFSSPEQSKEQMYGDLFKEESDVEFDLLKQDGTSTQKTFRCN